jgi:hypothetical protein
MKNNTNHEMSVQQVIAIMWREIERNKWTLEEAGQNWGGISKSYLSLQLSGQRPISQDVLDALGIEHIDKYKYKKK